MSDDIDLAFADDEWGRIRERSMSADGKMCCADCYFGYQLTGFACGKHITPEERIKLDEKLEKTVLEPHPFFAMLKKS